MISVIVYGRNDSHGYNLSKRATLSLNSIAESLTHEDDEILFVDWNTPKRLPAFPLSIADSLTSQARHKIKILRVPSWVHDQRFAQRTHLPTVEPVARNVALVRSNPNNRWVLSTNTDMCFLTQGNSLSDLVADLSEGYYALPRFELNEAFWEFLPRDNPKLVLETIRDWRSAFALDQVVKSFDFNVFDAPGDFQLAPREVFLEIGGFEEQMVLGWHVDSNLAKRMSLYFGEPRSLFPHVAGFHCNHNRSLTVHHLPRRPTNDLARFVELVDSPLSEARRIGLPDLEINPQSVELLELRLFAAPKRADPGVYFSDFRDPQSMRSTQPTQCEPALLGMALTLHPRPRVLYIGSSEVVSYLRVLEAKGLIELSAQINDPKELERCFPSSIDWIVIDFIINGIGEASSLGGISEPCRSQIVDLMRCLEMISRKFSEDWAAESPIVSVINAEANELTELIEVVLDAPGSQTFSRMRSGQLHSVGRRVRWWTKILAIVVARVYAVSLSGKWHLRERAIAGRRSIVRTFLNACWSPIQKIAVLLNRSARALFSMLRWIAFPLRAVTRGVCGLIPTSVRVRTVPAVDLLRGLASSCGRVVVRICSSLWRSVVRARQVMSHRVIKFIRRRSARHKTFLIDCGLQWKLVAIWIDSLAGGKSNF